MKLSTECEETTVLHQSQSEQSQLITASWTAN